MNLYLDRWLNKCKHFEFCPQRKDDPHYLCTQKTNNPECPLYGDIESNPSEFYPDSAGIVIRDNVRVEGYMEETK